MIKKIFTRVLFFGFLSCCLAQAEENPDELYRQGRFGEAEKAYALSDMDNPKDIRYRYNRGCSAYQNSDFNGARAAFSSVFRRTENEEIQFKAAYNLGNTAFKENDFESAVAQYKEALLSNPESEDAKYNLELSLRELEKLKKKTEEQKKEGQKTPDQSKDEGDSSKSGEKAEGPDQKQSEAQDQKNGKAQKEPDKQEAGKQEKDERPDEGQKAEQESPKDLSGELTPLQAMPEQGKDQTPEQVGAMLDRKKAEALLDNLNEDRSRFLRFQIPEDKKRGVQSGKDW
ncbi:MAG: tetratricopeptide repeat protein [Desulfobacteraceae bacterium]|nr:MAG: tetratricopeptide repeat protein [Desulfobacteraceae bacterium]